MASGGIMMETPRIVVTEMPMISSALPRVASHGGLMRTLVALALSCAACGESPTVLTAFQTEQQAQTHCPKVMSSSGSTLRAEPIISRGVDHTAGRAQAVMSAVAKRTPPACMGCQTDDHQAA